MGPSKKKKRGFLDGCAAGIVKLTTTMPLDTIKVQMQLRKATDPDYGTMASSARAIVRGHGMAGLYTGLSASLVNQGGKTGIQFAAYQFWREQLAAAADFDQSSLAFAAGALAGLTEAFCWTTPIERIKTLRQAELNAASPARADGAAIVRVFVVHGRIVANEFPLGLWRGTAPTMMRQASGLAVRFLTYDFAKERLERASGASAPWHSVAAGAFSGAASAVVNHPVDVIKSRMQAEASKLGEQRPSSVAYTANLLRTGGPAVFAHGLAPRVLKIMSGQAIVFGVYENIRSLLSPP